MWDAINEPDSCDPPLNSPPIVSSLSNEHLCRGKFSGPHPYDDPRLLSCLHSFCKNCLTNAITNDTVICPTCTEPTVISSKGIDGLPVNIRVLREIKAAKVIKKAKSSLVCEDCITDPPLAVSYCIDCEEFICIDCNELHKRKRILVNHKVIDLSNLTISSLLEKPKPSLCPRHTKEPLDLYCKECCTISCRLCVLTNHSGHTCTDINQIADSSKQELQKHLLPLTKAISEIQSLLKKNATTQVQLKKKTQNAKVTIETAFDKLIDTLTQRKKKLLQEVRLMSDVKQNKLEKKRKQLEKEVEKMNLSFQKIESTLATYTPEELVSTCEMLKTYLNKKMSSNDSSIVQPPSADSSEIKFSVDTKVIMSQINQFGKVEVPVNPSSSVIIGQKLAHCVAGKKTTITLEARDKDGKCLDKGGDVVVVQLVGKDNSVGTVYDKGNGQYELSFTPLSPGKYQLHVTINDEHVSNSPFPIHVFGRPYRDYHQLNTPVGIINVDDPPLGICTSSDGALYVSCVTSIQKYSSNGTAIVKQDGIEFKRYNWSIAVKGDVIYVANSSEKKIIQLTTAGKLINKFGTAGILSGIAVDEQGKVYINQYEHIYIYTSNGTLIKTINCDKRSLGLALDPTGNIHITFREGGSVAVYSADGKFLRQYGEGILNKPCGITVDEDGYCLVSEYRSAGQLKIFDPQGQHVHSVGNFERSSGVCIDNESHIFVTSEGDKKVYKF